LHRSAAAAAAAAAAALLPAACCLLPAACCLLLLPVASRLWLVGADCRLLVIVFIWGLHVADC